MVNRVAKTGFVSIFLTSMALAVGCADNSGDDYDEIDERNAEIVDNLIEAGFSEDDIEIREAPVVGTDLILNESELQVFVEGDMHVTLEASRDMLDKGPESFRHWRTPGIVSPSNSTICLAKATSAAGGFGSYVLTGAMQTGVNWANNNFNNVGGLSLNFKTGNASISSSGQLSTSMTGCTDVIYIYKVNGGAGGSAGFPSGGAAYNQVRLNSGLAGFSNNVHEHVATHEVGHAIGLRHTDWQTRQSCGQNSNEGQSGASQIPGTPFQTTNSIMAACFSGNSNGEFRGADQTALSTLY